MAEKSFNTTIEVKEYPPIKRNYFVPNFGYDHDIEDSKKNLAEVEKM